MSVRWTFRRIPLRKTKSLTRPVATGEWSCVSMSPKGIFTSTTVTTISLIFGMGTNGPGQFFL